jgi:hypothetical protein
MRKFMMFLNNAYIGSMSESFAHNVASVVCAKMGDVLTLEVDWQDSDSYYISQHWNEEAPTHTYYHNGTEVLCFTHTTSYGASESSEQEILRKARTSSYNKVLSDYKYTVSMARNMQHASESVSHMKRTMRRAERRVGKAVIAEQLDS